MEDDDEITILRNNQNLTINKQLKDLFGIYCEILMGNMTEEYMNTGFNNFFFNGV